MTAMARQSSVPRRTPQPIEPNHHSPRNRRRPTGRRMPRKRKSPAATPPRAATRLTSSPISESSARASSTCASTIFRAASIVAAICSRSPGGSERGSLRALGGASVVPSGGTPPGGPGLGPGCGEGSRVGGSSRVGLRWAEASSEALVDASGGRRRKRGQRRRLGEPRSGQMAPRRARGIGAR